MSRRSALLSLLVVLAPANALAWGDLGHLRITQQAHGLLPNGCLRTWYYDNGQALLEASLAPDAWRDSDPNEGPRHFLDIDLFGNPSAYPRDLNQAISQYGANTIYANGTVPWVAEAAYNQLVDEFRAGNTTNAVALSGYLSHYASDSYSPYHATVNYDGQLTGNDGIHGRYEVDMIEAYDTQVQSGLSSNAQSVPAPSVIHDAIFDVLENGVTLVAGINAVDTSSGRSIPALWNGKGQEAVSLMAQSSSLIGALWLAAYAEAGSPVMSGMPSACGGTPPVDGGTPDGGSPGQDAGGGPDASPGLDTGPGGPDAGPGPDGGMSMPDGGSSDPVDGGSPADAGGSKGGGDGTCMCDVDFCCSEGCDCDPECACECDSTYACDEGCECDQECQPGCPGFDENSSGGGGSSCRSLSGTTASDALIFVLSLVLAMGVRRRYTR